MNLLCRFAHRFPLFAAELLERDRHKRRNFKEETVTDLLMAGLVPFEAFGIFTNFPINEALTGQDMDWEFVDEHNRHGRRYLNLHIQAKRAILSKGRIAPYWYYKELDHAVGPRILDPNGRPIRPPYGSQHTILLNEAANVTGCVPLYMFYHPRLATAPSIGNLPAIEGINWIFAEIIPRRLSVNHWSFRDKKVDRWRPHFHPLADLLCFDRGNFVQIAGPPNNPVLFFIGPASGPSPGEIADRLNERRGSAASGEQRLSIEAVNTIPSSTLEIIRAGRERSRSAEIARPRIIFVTDPEGDRI